MALGHEKLDVYRLAIGYVAWVYEKADGLTGHHRVEAVCHYLETSGLDYGKLLFFHHGKAILQDPEAELLKARQILGDNVLLAFDGMTLTL